MSQFILFIRGGSDLSANLSPEQIQETVQRYSAWAQKLRAEGKLVSAEKLKDNTGMLLHSKDGRVMVDGPFAETKETIGGYFIIEARDMDEAIAIARESPALGGGSAVEIREIEA
ncbi:MAG TPA: YciI family protein [Anaerolineales bacterium]|nr:YciI family protein [Anaerolineales bacterium]